MSIPILPFAVWLSGTNENSIPANDNSLRNEILHGLVLSDAATAQPASPEDGDIYIIAATHTGAQWSLFDPDDLAIFKGGTWYAYAPVDGIRVNLDGVENEWTGSGGWVPVPGGGGGAVDSVNGQTGTVVLTEDDLVAGITTYTASQTAQLTDKVVLMNVASANNYTIPQNSSVAFPVGYSIEVWQQGAGQTTIVQGTGATLLYHSDNTLNLKGQNSGCSLRKVATNTWRLIGDMEQV